MFLHHIWDLRFYLVFSFVTFCCLFYYAWNRFFSLQGLPNKLPWAGAGYGLLRRGKASIQSIVDLRGLLKDGYEKYSKKEQPFILPNLVTGHEVILPMSQMQWLLSQPDNILSQHEANKQFLRAEYTMLHPSIIGEARMANFINRYLTRNLDVFAKDIVDEIEQALENTWGSESSKWHEISLYSVMLVIIGRIVNRVLVGLPLCRDPTYLHSSTKFAQMAPVTGGLISLLPIWLRPALAPFITAYDTLQYWRMFRMVEPIVRERLRIVGLGVNFKEQVSSQPNDFIQWACIEAFSQDEQVERTPEMIAKRLAVLSFAAIQSSTLTITNTLLDIAASSDSIWIQSALRLEALKTVEKNRDNAWTRASLAAMTMTDSVLRESLRLWSFVSHGVTKVVVTPNGLTLPSGEHLLYGAKCGIASYGPHHDSNVYDNPYAFRAFRFCRDRQSGVTIKADDKEGHSMPKSFVTTSEYFMGFSHGRHACPGRFFASQQLKLLLANIMLKYEIKPISIRPNNRWLNNTIGPDAWATLQVRRRNDTIVGAIGAVESDSGGILGDSSEDLFRP